MRSPMAASNMLDLIIHSRQPMTLRVMLLAGCSGLLAGLVLAYMAMCTVHAVRKHFLLLLLVQRLHASSSRNSML